jgi:two-component system, NarL family, sensor histidine kinase UhpB
MKADERRVPLDLPRRVMRRALAVAVLTLLAALGLGLARTDSDIDGEVRAAMSLAAAMARLSQSAQLSDAELVAVLRARDDETPLRHLSLAVRDGAGRLLLGRLHEPSASPVIEWLTDLHRRLRPGRAVEPVTWMLPRPGREPWTLTLAAQRDSERREAVAYLGSLLVVLVVGVVVMLAVMAWNVRSAFRPLEGLLAAIGRIQSGDTGAARSIPAMPIGELEQIAAALRSLGDALDAAEAERRLLGHKVQSLQEEERMRLARELHDEFGQRLTAIRLDAAWLAQRLKDLPDVQPVVQGMSEQCAAIQSDVRTLLARLQPLGGMVDGEADTTVATLAELLQGLAEGWRRSASGALRVELVIDADPERRLPRDLALALYRISQEALTNVARHAQAGEVTLSLRWPAGSEAIAWSVADDGIGLADSGAALRRGNGLAGIKERIWAFGGDLSLQAAMPARERTGLVLAATLRAPATRERVAA